MKLKSPVSIFKAKQLHQNESTYDLFSKETLEKKVRNKAIITRDYVDFIEFGRPITINSEKRKLFKTTFSGASGTISERFMDYQKRKKSRLTASLNYYFDNNFRVRSSCLVTFTYDLRKTGNSDLSDLKQSNVYFAKMIKRMTYTYKVRGITIKYVGVPEFQERGIIHYHIIFNRQRIHIKFLHKIWPYGGIEVKTINYKGNFTNYLLKYINKTYDDMRFYGKRVLLCSKNLDKPVVLYGQNAVSFVRYNALKGFKPVFSSQYSSEFAGKIVRSRLLLDKDYKRTTI